MFFKKKQKPVERYWEDKEYMALHTIRDYLNELNESQRRLGLVDGGEYYETIRNISGQIDKTIEEMQIAIGAFDEMMGKPLEQLDEMMEVFNERTVQDA